MGCSCAVGWSTSTIAASKGLTWRNASDADRPLLNEFLRRGGSGYASIDEFVRDELISHSQEHYAQTSLLLDSNGNVIGFVTNAMGEIAIENSELLNRNMLPIERVPTLFLHRLGVLKSMQNKGLGALLVLRVFEILVHACDHTAAAVVALKVAKENVPARGLYEKMLFEPAKVRGPAGKFDLFILPFDTARNQIPVEGQSPKGGTSSFSKN